jgi:DNA-binding MarR family transcriptional regulator
MKSAGSSTKKKSKASQAISLAEYQALAEFRYLLASFLRRRRHAAVEAGLEPQQYELLLTVRGLPKDKKPSIKQVAEQLKLQHHSAVELTTRLAKRGLVRRERSKEDRRLVLLSLTKKGEHAVGRVVQYSLEQLQDEGPELLKALGRLVKEAR